MQAELVQVTTSDGVTLDGAFFDAAPRSVPGRAIDAFLLVHGSGGNFYRPLHLSMAQRLRDHGYPCVSFNTTGHDIAWNAPGSDVYWGNAFEVLDRCRLDLLPMTEWLVGRGFRRIALLGHSMGAVKVVYYQALEQDPTVAAVIAVSPVRLSYSHYMRSPDEPEFRRMYLRAQQLIQSGRGHELFRVTFPIPHIFSARAYVDKHGPAENYNLLKYVDQLPCPLLVVSGTLETHTRLRDLPLELVTTATQGHVRAEMTVIEGADHGYTGMEGAAADRVLAWVDTLGISAEAAADPDAPRPRLPWA